MFKSPGAVAIQFGPLTLHWYGLIIALAVLAGTMLASREAKRRGEDAEALLNVLVFSVLAALVGARLYYVIFNWSFYWQSPARIFAIWEGGLAIHGGIAGGFILGFIMMRTKRLPIATYLDIVAPSMILGQALGRWGNFFNQEAFGVPTDLPWKLYIDAAYRPAEYAQFSYFHPTFLYESVWDFLVFATLFGVLRKRLAPYSGALFLIYLALYSVGRFFIEGLRTDSLMLGSFRVAQLVSVALIVLAAVAVPLIIKKKYKVGQSGGR